MSQENRHGREASRHGAEGGRNRAQEGDSPRENERPRENETAGESLDFEASMARLDRIVQELESPQVGLEHAIRLFEEGLELGNHCSALLERARARVEKLLERADGSAETRPMEPME